MLQDKQQPHKEIELLKKLYGSNFMKMRAPCKKCGCKYGLSVWKSTQETIRCKNCDTWCYNNPRSESTASVNLYLVQKENMMTPFVGFDHLDLSNIDIEGSIDLPVGEYVCAVKSASVEITNSGIGRYAKIILESVDGHGSVIDRFTLENPNPVSVEIGLKKLKLFLIAAKHSNPNHPGDITSLYNLLVMVGVKEGNNYTNKHGEITKGQNVVDYYKPLSDNAK